MLTELVLATALIFQPRWPTKNGSVLRQSSTGTAGLVAVAKPFSEYGVDVASVIAAPDVPPTDAWRAVDEVIAKLNEGALWHGELPASGHLGPFAKQPRLFSSGMRPTTATTSGAAICRAGTPPCKAH